MATLKQVLLKLSIVIFALLLYFSVPPKAWAAVNPGGGGGVGYAQVISGIQVPSQTAFERLLRSQFKVSWVKFQYSLGSDQPLEEWIKQAHANNYKVLISVAKNMGGIETLQDPIYTPSLAYPQEYTHQYCPWEEELEKFTRTESYTCIDYDTPTPAYKTCYRNYEVTATLKADNGYVKFRDQMRDLAPRLAGADAVEIWNEPNLPFEWTDAGLGPVDATRYAQFLRCGVKGLKRGGFVSSLDRPIISAALSPLSSYPGKDPTQMGDITYFNEFVNAGGLEAVDAIGWHSNVQANIPPYDENRTGFQRFRYALENSKTSPKPLWLTEFGWTRKNTGVTCQLQSRYITEAYRVVSLDPTFAARIRGMLVWNFGFGKENPDPEFKFWDLEECQINPFPDSCVAGKGNQRLGYPDSDYVTSPTSKDDWNISKTTIQATMPLEVGQTATLAAITTPRVTAIVEKGFLENLVGTLKQFFCTAFGLGYCEPTMAAVPEALKAEAVELGIPEATNESSPSGRDTALLASRAETLRRANTPDMIYIPPQKDCNFVQNASDTSYDIGDELWDQTTNGFDMLYGASTPPLVDAETNITNRMTKDNVAIGHKLFDQDKRGPQMENNFTDFCKGSFATEQCPMYITPPAEPIRTNL